MKKIGLYNFKNGQALEKRFPGKKVLSAAVFWGAVWGWTEATLGYLLHLLKIPGLAGAVMAAIVFYFLDRLYQQTGSAGAVVFSSFLAAGLKSLDIVVSPVGLMDVINPVQAIIIEGLVAALALKVLNRRPVRSRLLIIIPCLLFPFGSNLAYGFVTLVESGVFHLSNIFEVHPAGLVTFLLLSPLLTAALVAVRLIKSRDGKKETGKVVSPVKDQTLLLSHPELGNLVEVAAFQPGFSAAVLILGLITSLIHF
jgi:ABC-type thiamin/hydroxymethylpyrimidine transport system permease subunit